jgi:tetratricopeptide (TPR) repeat protein
MFRSVVRAFLSAFVVFSLFASADSQTTQKAIGASQLMALAAGNVLPANLVHEIALRGIRFNPNDNYREALKKAGADDKVLQALNQAKVIGPVEDINAERDLIRQLSAAGADIKTKQYDQAVNELSEALQGSFASPEAGFVMGEVLRQKGDWQRSAMVYEYVLQHQPDFPEIHTKFSFVLYRSGDYDEALHQAKIALATDPQNAEAHKCAGLALDSLGKIDAAITEYKTALTLEPDYAVVHYDLGNLYLNRQDYDNAIPEYKKAIALDPTSADTHTNLAGAYFAKGEVGLAISERREAKRLSPNDPVVWENLAAVLMSQNPNEAIAELQQMEKLFPESEVCHLCLARGLLWRGDTKAAEAEFQKAIRLDPSDSQPHMSLGEMHEGNKEFDAALGEFRLAERLDPNNAETHLAVGRVLLAKNDASGAIAELQQAEALSASDPKIHDIYGQALLATKQNDLAISEFKEAVALDPKQSHSMFELASALEQSGDWSGALEQYKRAALIEASANRDHRPGQTFYYTTEAEEGYKAAQTRFAEHLKALNIAGKTAEAKELQERLQVMENSGDLATKVQMAIQAGDQAATMRKYDDCEKSYKEAVELAEQLPPGDANLIEALKKLGTMYEFNHSYQDASATFHRELAIIEKTYGANSERVTDPLFSLANVAYAQKNYVEEEGYFSRSLEINLKLFGESSQRTENNLRTMAFALISQQQWAKAESYLLRAVKADEVRDGPNNYNIMMSLPVLCHLYDSWDRPDKSQPCWQRTVTLMEAQWGQNEPDLALYIDSEAKALRQLGRTSEADQLEQRSAKLKQAKMQTK